MVRLRIVVDEREKASGIPEFLLKSGVRVDYAKLYVGDYIMAPDVGVERKSGRDLLSSIYDGRLFEQCRALSAFRKPILIIEGEASRLEELAENLKAAFGALAYITLVYNISILNTSSPKSTALILLALAENLSRERKPGALLVKTRKSEDPKLQQMYMVASLPGVGVKLAKRLLELFETPRAVFSASVSELARVPRLGYARALRIDHALNSPWKHVSIEKVRQAKLSDVE